MFLWKVAYATEAYADATKDPHSMSFDAGQNG